MSEERLLHAGRTCSNCSKSEVCWAFREMRKIIEVWPAAGFVGAGAPGWSGDIYMALANSCLEFEFKKLK